MTRLGGSSWYAVEYVPQPENPGSGEYHIGFLCQNMGAASGSVAGEQVVGWDSDQRTIPCELFCL